MIFPDVSLEEWLKRYPQLRNHMPRKCRCGIEVMPKPWIEKDWVGLQNPPCDACQTLGASLRITTNAKLKRDLQELFGSI